MASCYQDSKEFTPQDPIINVANFFNLSSSDYNEYIFDASAGLDTVTTNESQYLIEPNSLVYSNGDIVQGEVILNITEIDNLGEIIANNLAPTQTQILSIEKLLNLAVRTIDQNNILEFSEGKNIQIKTRARNHQETHSLNIYEIDTGNQNWSSIDSNVTFGVFSYQDPSSEETITVPAFQYTVAHSKWFGIAQPVFEWTPNQNEFSLCSELPEKYDEVNTSFFLIQGASNCVINLKPTKENLLFCAQISREFLNKEINLVTISTFSNDIFKLGMTNALLTEEILVIEPETKNIPEIIQELKDI